MESPGSIFLLRNCWHYHLSLFAWDQKKSKVNGRFKYSPVITKVVGFFCCCLYKNQINVCQKSAKTLFQGFFPQDIYRGVHM